MGGVRTTQALRESSSSPYGDATRRRQRTGVPPVIANPETLQVKEK
ncbi:MAG: hypothetical protein IPJ61_19400 [Tessaracoccus sp.]|nr:hypothetical protein [Tessaracoccus sp.]MBK7823154.1 hypothetical protein [Tessaracoccus sp.]